MVIECCDEDGTGSSNVEFIYDLGRVASYRGRPELLTGVVQGRVGGEDQGKIIILKGFIDSQQGIWGQKCSVVFLF